MARAGFPVPFTGDPEYIYENAVFQALAHPFNRVILGLLSKRAMTLDELSEHVLDFHSIREWLPDLVATGLIGVTGDGDEIVYSLRAENLARVTKWISSLDR